MLLTPFSNENASQMKHTPLKWLLKVWLPFPHTFYSLFLTLTFATLTMRIILQRNSTHYSTSNEWNKVLAKKIEKTNTSVSLSSFSLMVLLLEQIFSLAYVPIYFFSGQCTRSRRSFNWSTRSCYFIYQVRKETMQFCISFFHFILFYLF